MAVSPDADYVAFFTSDSANVELLRYQSLKAWDANENVLPASFVSLTPNSFAIVVEDEGASYPVTVDPTLVEDYTGPQTYARFGWDVAPVGEITGSGSQGGGIVVGARNFDGGQTDEGKVFVYFADYDDTTLPTTPTWTMESDQAYAHLGISVFGYFDVDGDGYWDVMAGAPDYDSGGYSGNGRVFVWEGSANGLVTGSTLWEKSGSEDNQDFGHSIASADVNNDGYHDLIIGAPNTDSSVNDVGAVYVFHGSSTGPSSSADWSKTGTYSGSTGSLFGWSVANGKDVNNDGISDLLVGAIYGHDSGGYMVGYVKVFHGDSSGLSSSADTTLYGQSVQGYFGYSVAGIGDVQNDNYDDIVVGAPYDENGQNNEGVAYVFHGSSSGVSTSADWKAESNQEGALFGYSVTGGQYTTDGFSPDDYADVIVGAPYFDYSTWTNNGIVIIWHGSSSGLGADGNPSNVDEAPVFSGHDYAKLGHSVAYVPRYAYSSLPAFVVGAPDEQSKGGVSVWEYDP